MSSNGLESENPGRDAQRVGTARFLGEDVAKIHSPVWAVTGSLGDSQCYLGVRAKVAAVQTALSERVRDDGLAVRLIAPAYTIGVSDGQLNGTPSMRFSMAGRELVNENIDLHLNANSVAGLIAVVACDKPPVGTLAAILEVPIIGKLLGHSQHATTQRYAHLDADPMRRAVERYLEDPLAKRVLAGEFPAGTILQVDGEAGAGFRIEAKVHN